DRSIVFLETAFLPHFTCRALLWGRFRFSGRWTRIVLGRLAARRFEPFFYVLGCILEFLLGFVGVRLDLGLVNLHLVGRVVARGTAGELKPVEIVPHRQDDNYQDDQEPEKTLHWLSLQKLPVAEGTFATGSSLSLDLLNPEQKLYPSRPLSGWL